MNSNIIYVDWDNKQHIKSLLHCIKVYMLDAMGNVPIHDDIKEANLVKLLRYQTNGIYYLILSGNKPVGLAITYKNISTFTAKPFLNIHDFIILPDYRNQGFGKKLLQFIIKDARKKRCSKVTLEVRVDNISAQNLYMKMGFAPTNPPMKFWIKELK